MKHIKEYLETINEAAGHKLTLVHQVDGITCGPTALYMIANYLNINTSIEELKIVMGTDKLTGTTDAKMQSGLEYLSLDWERFPVDARELAYSKLNAALERDGIILFRTLTRGIKHWICCDSKDGDRYHVLDPWLGEREVDAEELEEAWGSRGWDGFVVYGKKKPMLSDVRIKRIERRDIPEVVQLASLVFSNVMPYKANVNYISSATDFDQSVKLVMGNEIIGCYLVNPRELRDFPGKKGIEGIALAIKPAYRGHGFGEQLKDWLEDYAKEAGYDFIFGVHLKGLHNIDYWLKRRELYAETSDLFYTIKHIKK